MVKDVNDIAAECGFRLEDVHTLKNIKRCGGAVGWDGDFKINDNSEKIFVFGKEK